MDFLHGLTLVRRLQVLRSVESGPNDGYSNDGQDGSNFNTVQPQAAIPMQVLQLVHVQQWQLLVVV